LNAQEKKANFGKTLIEKSQSSAAIVKVLIDKKKFEEYYIQEDRVNFKE
jgi:hypothetical protein